MTPDSELLLRYAKSHCEEAFAELVRRHVNLVYSTVLRRLNGDTHLAQDAAQSVFTDLARKALALSRRTTLTGWLYTSAHYAAVDIVRKEGRRRNREEKFMAQPSSPTESDPEWEKLRPVLDDVMLQLKESDREAILLRYFENRPLAEVGAKLGLAENAARMRVDRALDKLRALLAKRGIATTSSLVAAISAGAIEVAPPGLAGALITNSMAAAGAGTFTLLQIMTATKIKFGLGALVIAGATTALVIQYQTEARILKENEILRRQMTQLQSDNANLSTRPSMARGSQSLSGDQLRELLRLRGEVGRLRDQTNKLGMMRHDELERQMTGNIEGSDNTKTDQDQQRQIAMAKMSDAKLMALAEILYAQKNQGQLATNYEQIASYLTNSSTPFTGTNNFELVYQGALEGLTNGGSLLLMRESEAWPTTDGKWARSYVFVDGHAEIHVQPSDNFDDFEQQHMSSTP